MDPIIEGIINYYGQRDCFIFIKKPSRHKTSVHLTTEPIINFLRKYLETYIKNFSNMQSFDYRTVEDFDNIYRIYSVPLNCNYAGSSFMINLFLEELEEKIKLLKTGEYCKIFVSEQSFTVQKSIIT